MPRVDESPMIEVRGLSRRFGSVRALDDVTFHVARGAVVGFLGPNGAGKTTTMKILTGTLAPTRGTAQLAGFDVTAPSSGARARLGYLPENAPVPPEMSVVEYLRFVARVRGIARAKRTATIERVIERCSLGEMRRRALGALSKGFRQRVGVAQAILHDPDVLILDEPTTGLDPNQVLHMRALVREIGRDKTVLFSSHVLEEVQAVADRVLILDRGRLVADDTPAALGARLAGARIAVTVAGDGAGLRPTLEAVPGVRAVQIEVGAESTVARLEADAGLRPLVARAVVEGGFDVLSLGLEQADLASVFRQLTGARA